jgi:hypothetical protein
LGTLKQKAWFPLGEIGSRARSRTLSSLGTSGEEKRYIIGIISVPARNIISVPAQYYICPSAILYLSQRTLSTFGTGGEEKSLLRYIIGIISVPAQYYICPSAILYLSQRTRSTLGTSGEEKRYDPVARDVLQTCFIASSSPPIQRLLPTLGRERSLLERVY